MKQKFFLTVFAGLILMFSASFVSAANISLTPNSSNAAVGDTVLVDLSISDLLPDGVAAIHADLWFDTSVLSFQSATAGDFFDNNPTSVWVDFGTFGLTAGDPIDTSRINVTSAPDILGFDFIEFNFVDSTVDGVLATLEFEAIGVGSADFTLNDVSAFDGDFLNPSDILADTTAGNVNVSAVPEPSTIILMGIGVLGFFAFGWKRRNCLGSAMSS
ncbi:MAG: PEP-CTERM sorting domain-containing protein [Candidatus Scalindua sp.]|nr:PEP-CTERM sorting domain-containing protein [Candidatus Scalindua sp.]